MSSESLHSLKMLLLIMGVLCILFLSFGWIFSLIGFPFYFIIMAIGIALLLILFPLAGMFLFIRLIIWVINKRARVKDSEEFKKYLLIEIDKDIRRYEKYLAKLEEEEVKGTISLKVYEKLKKIYSSRIEELKKKRLALSRDL